MTLTRCTILIGSLLASLFSGGTSFAGERYEVAAYYFPGYHPDPRNDARLGKGWTEWQLIKAAKPRFPGHVQPKVPLWGYRDESDPQAFEQKIDAAADHGITAFIMDWYWYQNAPFLNRALDEGFLKAKNRSRLKFALMWANHDWIDIFPYKRGSPRTVIYPGKVSRAIFENVMDHVIRRYFKQPNYWKINGKPYFSIYHLGTWLDSFGSVEATRAALDEFRRRTEAAGFPGLHLNAVGWGQPRDPRSGEPIPLGRLIEQLGFDSATSYVWVHHVRLPEMQTDYEWARNAYFDYWDRGERMFKVPYFPNVTVGWDSSPRADQSDEYGAFGYPFTNTIANNTPARFAEALRAVRQKLDGQPDAPRIVTINSWNEWTEGSYLEPDTANGMKYLQAVRDVFPPAQAVATDTAETPAVFRAGAAVADITPKLNVSLNGTISKPGPVKGVHDRLHARALVLDDGRTRLAFVITDLTMIERAVCDQAKVLVQRQTGVPRNRVLISAVHTHAAPRVRHGRAGPLDDQYYEFLIKQIAAAVAQAVDNLAPAKIGWGSFDKPEYVRCRRSLCKPGTLGPNPFGESGERVKSVAGKGGDIIKPAGPVDSQVSILSVQHADGRPLAVLANYSVHYCGGYQRGMVSADYFGYFARRLEEKLDAGSEHPPFVGIMSNGTSGNTSSIQSGGKRYSPFEWMQIAGGKLADETLRVVQQIEHRSDITLAMRDMDLELGTRLPDEKRVAWARAVLANPKTPWPHPWTPVFAQQILLLSQYSPTRPVKLQAIRIGELCIASVACEVFAETGLAIKKDSPFNATFTISLANGSEGYLPPPQQHEWGGYETWPATSSCLEVQAEPKIHAALMRLLQDVK